MFFIGQRDGCCDSKEENRAGVLKKKEFWKGKETGKVNGFHDSVGSEGLLVPGEPRAKVLRW